MSVQLGTHVPNTLAQVFNAPGRGYMMCGHATQSMHARLAYMQLQYNANAMDHSHDTITVPSYSTTRHHTANGVQRGRR
jgi:hypothetical protein